MERRIHNFFEKVADSLFTLPPIMIGMFAMYGYLVYESHALLITQLPESLIGWQRHTAAWFLSVAIHLTILTTAANSQLVHQAFPLLFALAGYFITTLFFEAWQWDTSQENYRQGIFVSQLFSVLIAVINYLFVYLFVGKYKELKGEQQEREALQQAQEDVVSFRQAATRAEQQLAEIKQTYLDCNQNLEASQQALTRAQRQIEQQQREHQEALQLVHEHRMCHRCGAQADTYQQLSRYKRDCAQCKEKRKKQRASLQKEL
jgi:hypothetical protein